jgi:hypothetical protein
MIIEQGTIIAVKAAKIKSYLGTNSINVELETLLWIDPTIPEAGLLSNWMAKQLGVN